MNHRKYLDEERKTINNLIKKYTKLLNVYLGTEVFINILELGIVGTCIAVLTIKLNAILFCRDNFIIFSH